MPVVDDLLFAAPASVAAVVVIVRFGPHAAVTLIAGVVASLTSDPERGDRALAVLELLHPPCRRSRRKHVSPHMVPGSDVTHCDAEVVNPHDCASPGGVRSASRQRYAARPASVSGAGADRVATN